MATRAICGNCRNLLCRKCGQYHTPDSMTHRNALRYCRLAKGQGMKLAKREFTSPACTLRDPIDQPAVGRTGNPACPATERQEATR